MRIGIDIDSTLAEAMPVFLAHIEKKHGLHMTKEDIKEWHMKWGDIELYDEICEVLNDPEQLKDIPLVKGADRAMEFLTKNFDVVLITSRTPNTKDATKEWATDKFGDIEVFHTEKDKNGFNVDILIDDAPHQIEYFVSKGGYGIVFNQPWNQNVKGERIFRANNWEEALYFVEMIRLTILLDGQCAGCSKKSTCGTNYGEN